MFVPQWSDFFLASVNGITHASLGSVDALEQNVRLEWASIPLHRHVCWWSECLTDVDLAVLQLHVIFLCIAPLYYFNQCSAGNTSVFTVLALTLTMARTSGGLWIVLLMTVYWLNACCTIFALFICTLKHVDPLCIAGLVRMISTALLAFCAVLKHDGIFKIALSQTSFLLK